MITGIKIIIETDGTEIQSLEELGHFQETEMHRQSQEAASIKTVIQSAIDKMMPEDTAWDFREFEETEVSSCYDSDDSKEYESVSYKKWWKNKEGQIESISWGGEEDEPDPPIHDERWLRFIMLDSAKSEGDLQSYYYVKHKALNTDNQREYDIAMKMGRT